jgi:NTP pyrophosphatase (non-canonical NTP hydrolase)
MTENEIYKAAIAKFGEVSQQDMVIEECAELIQAINKYRRKPGCETLEALASEIADVKIMLAQLEIILDSDDMVNEEKQIKLERLKKLVQ